MPALAALVVLASEVPDQTQVFYNARLSLRGGQPAEALRFWLLRNALRQQGVKAPDDAEFRSVVWASLGELGLCPDGFPPDDQGGATLWPLALHNQVVLSSARGEPPDRGVPFEAFEVGRQQRFISLHDVLDLSELRAVAFSPTSCAEPGRTLAAEGLAPAGLLTDRRQQGAVLRSLLELALTKVDRRKVLSLAVVEARLFDLNLELARLEQQAARQAALLAVQSAAAKRVSRPAQQELRAKAEAWSPTSLQTLFLRAAMGWSVDEWLSLSRERRLALFARARPFAKSPEARDALVRSMLDELVSRREGAEVEAWISLFAPDAAGRRGLVDGERGQRLLELDASTGFRERAAIALARGVLLLERGERREALRSFALAMKVAGESREGSGTSALARRWLSYLLGSFQTNDELIATLQALVPPLEYNAVIEDLVWKAALRADRISFEALVSTARRGGAFDARAVLLQPLAQGRAGALVDALVALGAEEPHAMLRFVNTLLEHVEAEELDVRRALTPLLRALGRVLDGLTGREVVSRAQVRRAEELARRTQAVLTGLGLLAESPVGRARALSPGQPAFAGNVRLAPNDVLPWPFPPVEPVPASPFRPLRLEPVEWRDAAGALVFGWRVSE